MGIRVQQRQPHAPAARGPVTRSPNSEGLGWGPPAGRRAGAPRRLRTDRRLSGLSFKFHGQAFTLWRDRRARSRAWETSAPERGHRSARARLRGAFCALRRRPLQKTGIAVPQQLDSVRIRWQGARRCCRGCGLRDLCARVASSPIVMVRCGKVVEETDSSLAPLSCS